MSDVCKLYLKKKTLKKSHILPRAIFRRRKRVGKSQLVSVTTDEHTAPDLSNCNPSEPLLCGECENKILNGQYESYADQLLTGKFPVEKKSNAVVLSNFNYPKFYLYLVSILWRASISSIEQFKGINLGREFNEILRQCIISSNIKLGTSLKLDHFVRISMYRIVDGKNFFDDNTIKSLILNLNVYKGETTQDGMYYYLMFEGFFIIIRISAGADLHDVRTHKEPAQITGTFNSLTVPFCDFRKIPVLEHALACLVIKAKKHGPL